MSNPQSAEFQLQLPTQTIVTTAFVKSRQNGKCPVLSNRTVCLILTVYMTRLAKKFCDKLFSIIPFILFQQFNKTQLSAENTILLLFTLIASTNVT